MKKGGKLVKIKSKTIISLDNSTGSNNLLRLDSPEPMINRLKTRQGYLLLKNKPSKIISLYIEDNIKNHKTKGSVHCGKHNSLTDSCEKEKGKMTALDFSNIY